MIRQSVGLGFLKQSQDLLPLHTGKPLEKFCDRIPAFQVIKQTLYRYSGSRKDRLSSEDFWVSHDYVAHTQTITSPADLCEAILPLRFTREGR